MLAFCVGFVISLLSLGLRLVVWCVACGFGVSLVVFCIVGLFAAWIALLICCCGFMVLGAWGCCLCLYFAIDACVLILFSVLV